MNHRRSFAIELLLNVILFATLAAALLHVFTENAKLENYLFLAAVVLPAFAGALAGISIFHHFHENAERYAGMRERLSEIDGRMSDRSSPAPSLADLQRLVLEADRCMSHEHHGWRVVFGTQLPGPG